MKSLVVVADTHVNSTVGLICPMTTLDDGGEYRPSKGQRWLWRNWLDFWDSTPSDSWVIFNGDLCEVDSKSRSRQLITRNKATIQRITIDTIKPALDKAERVFVIRGTPAHVGKSAEFEEAIAHDIGAERTPDGMSSWWSLLIDCEGVLFDIAHRGPLGRLPWTGPNPLNALSVRLSIAYTGRRAPDVAVRNHNHHYHTSSDGYPIKVIAAPAWQLGTEHVPTSGIVEAADIGGLVFACREGGYGIQARLYKPEAGRAWRPIQTRT